TRPGRRGHARGVDGPGRAGGGAARARPGAAGVARLAGAADRRRRRAGAGRTRQHRRGGGRGRMKLGLSLGYSGFAATDAAPLVEHADRIGVDSVWVSEAYGADAVSVLA